MTKKLNAVTLTELVIGMIVLSIIIVASAGALKPKSVKEDALHKAGRVMYDELAIVTTDVLTRYSASADLTKLYTLDKSSKFQITDNDAVTKLSALYASRMRLAKAATTMTYTGYSGNYKLKNGSFFAIKLYGNCTTNTTTYNPMYDSEAMNEYDTCGAIFYDVNELEGPNTLGLDRYIIAIDKQGMR